MTIEAFVDPGFSSPEAFHRGFLASSEFSLAVLRGLLDSSPGGSTKEDVARSVAQALESGALGPKRIMRSYATQSRTWLSFRVGGHSGEPKRGDPSSLVHAFETPGWYGPLKDLPKSDRVWYFKTHRLRHVLSTPASVAQGHAEAHIRWIVTAEVTKTYAALTWDGFTHAPGDVGHRTRVPFPYWTHLPAAWNELSEICSAEWAPIALDQLVLETLWDKYVGDPAYRWDHRRIRSEASGVAFNAHGGTPDDAEIRGLKALTAALTKTVSGVLKLVDPQKKTAIENALLKTLIKEWGPKSYEFSLDTLGTSTEPAFRGHCYFGHKPTGQDSLQHVHCFQTYGGSTQSLAFLLDEHANA